MTMAELSGLRMSAVGLEDAVSEGTNGDAGSYGLRCDDGEP